ncbi:MAG: type II secretion system GspH family protein [Gallionella sp.]|nr:type II secretion system GspH family protein [Gallionella sp.]
MARILHIRSTRDSGFTLVELAVIILLVGILAFTAIPRFAGPSLRVDAQAEQLASDIRYTQTLAMTRGDRFRINLTATGYQITSSTGATTVVHPGTGSTNAVALNGVTLSGWNPPLTNDYVAFDGRGVPYSLYTSSTGLAANATITLSGGGSQRNLVISPETGRVVRQ